MASTTVHAKCQVARVGLTKLTGENYRSLDEHSVGRLAASLGQHGQLQPIAVAVLGDTYDVIFGFHRIEAAKRLGWEVIDAVIYPADLVMADRLAMQIVENLERNSGDRLELAAQVRRLADEVGSNREAAKRLGLSESWICKLLKILDLGEALGRLVREKKLALRAAYALSRVKDGALRSKLTADAVERGLSVDQIEAILREQQKPATAVKRVCLGLGRVGSMTVAVARAVTPNELVKEIESGVKELRKLADAGHDLGDFLTLVAMQSRKRGAA